MIIMYEKVKVLTGVYKTTRAYVELQACRSDIFTERLRIVSILKLYIGYWSYTYIICFKGVWIGLYNDVTSWRWSLADQRFYKDAEEHEFRNWTSGKPGDHLCAKVVAKSGWSDDYCGRQLYSICFNHTGETCLLNST